MCVCVYCVDMVFALFSLDNIHDQLHVITENLQVFSAEVRSKLQDNVVVSVEGGMVVDRSLRSIQVADVVNKVFKCLICHALRHHQYLWKLAASKS